MLEPELRTLTASSLEGLFVSELWRSKDRAAQEHLIERVLSLLKSNARLSFDVAKS